MSDPFNQLSILLTRLILPITAAIGILGNIINLIVLSRPALRKYACTKYFTALASNNLFYSSFVLIYRLLADGYQYDVANTSIASCKLTIYVLNVCSAISPHLIVLASIDRYWISSRTVRRRELSDARVAHYLIILVTAFFSLFYMSTPIIIDLRQDDFLGCRIRFDTIYNRVYVIIQVILFALVAPFLMTLFGLLTIHNTQHLSIVPTVIGRRRRTENQLLRMLLLQVGTHIVFTMPISVVSILSLFPGVLQPVSFFLSLTVLFRIPLHLTYATASLLYFSSAQLYRRELLRLVRKTRQTCRKPQIHPVVSFELR